MTEHVIEVNNLSKSFKIFHEKRDSIFDSVMNFFNKKRHFETLQVLDKISPLPTCLDTWFRFLVGALTILFCCNCR